LEGLLKRALQTSFTRTNFVGGIPPPTPPVRQKSYPIQKPKSQPWLVVAKSVYFVQSKCIG